MAAEGGTRAVVTALGANLGVAVAKFVAAAITGSTSMLAEGVHRSGLGKPSAAADRGQAAQGRPRRHCIRSGTPAPATSTRSWSRRPVHPRRALRPLRGLPQDRRPAPVSSPLVAVVVLLIAFVLEGYALRTLSARPTAPAAAATGWRSSACPRSPNCRSFCSKTAARWSVSVVGLARSRIERPDRGNGVYDGISSSLHRPAPRRHRDPARPGDNQPAHRRGSPPGTDRQDLTQRSSGNPRRGARSFTCARCTSAPTTCSSQRRSACRPRVDAGRRRRNDQRRRSPHSGSAADRADHLPRTRHLPRRHRPAWSPALPRRQPRPSARSSLTIRWTRSSAGLWPE